MTRLTIDQVAATALRAGLTPAQAVTATAIAMRESSGDTSAHNPVYPDDSYGLWQINRLAWPQFSPAELATADGNARAMMVVSQRGTNWQPWQIGGNPLARTDPAAAREAVARAQAAGGTVPDEGVDAGASAALAGISIPNPVDGVGQLVQAAQTWAKFAATLSDPKTWVRVLEVVAGLGLVSLGLYVIARDLGADLPTPAQAATPNPDTDDDDAGLSDSDAASALAAAV